MRSPSIILIGLLLATPLAAAAPGCPDCPFTGPAGNNSWDEAKLGAKAPDAATAAGHGGLAVAKAHEKKGPWAWFGVCLDAVVEKLDKITRFHLGVHAEARAYTSQDGVNVDGNVLGHDVDKLPVAGKLDDATWQVAGQLHEKGAPRVNDTPVEGEAIPDVVVQTCATVSCAH